MYAIIADGGRQFRVAEGQIVDIDYRDTQPGAEVKFERVLAGGDGASLKFGTPALSGATVTGEVVGSIISDKIVIQKFRRRKTTRRRNGHRQMLTRVKISKISL